MGRSRNDFCYRNATMLPICIVVDLQQYKTVECCHRNAKGMGYLCAVMDLQSISYCCQQYKHTWDFMESSRYCCQILTKSEWLDGRMNGIIGYTDITCIRMSDRNLTEDCVKYKK